MSPSLPPLGVLAGALLLLVVQSAGAADCTYRKDVTVHRPRLD